MKTKTFLWRAMLGCMAALAMCLCYACSEDEPAPNPTPEQPKTGEVDFKIDLPNNSGTGTTSSPVEVTSGEALNLEISQTSSYTDPNGQVITREPKATIALEIQLDTVVAKDLASLTKVKDVSDSKTTTSGTSPVRHQTTQKLEVGGQEIAFDLAYEVYTLTNSLNQKVEMPYIKLNQAKFGSANTTEETPQGRSAIAVSAVKVRPLAKSRSYTVTDSAMYEVEVRFNVGLESVNTKESNPQSLEFSATYVGVVETTTTLEDPKVELTYDWNVISGTNSVASPFVQTKGQDMELSLTQASVYTDEYTNRYTCEPKAKIKISALQDTVWAGSADGLKPHTNTTDVDANSTSANQVFSVGNKNINIEWSYDVATAPEGLNVEMPYFKLGKVTFKDATMKKIEGNNSAMSEKNVEAYEITATFTQKAEATSQIGNFAQSFDVEYVVTYIGAIEVKLVDVKYIKEYEWSEPHDNLPLRVRYILKRELNYSNGTSVVTEYKTGNYMFEILLSTGNPYGSIDYLEEKLPDGGIISFINYIRYNDNYRFYIYSSKTGVPDLSKLTCKLYKEGFYNTFGPGYWDTYTMDGANVEFGTGTHKEACYVKRITHYHTMHLCYPDYSGPLDTGIRSYKIEDGYTDRFYYFSDTDTIVDFSEFRPVTTNNLVVTDTTITEGPARLYRHECSTEYLGEKFYFATVDTVYQNQNK